MEQYLDRNFSINLFYGNFIRQASMVDDENPNKYAWMVGWSDKDNQYKRFEILTGIGIKKNDTVLDIGCGAGEFVQYCKDCKIKIDYTGIDINPYYSLMAIARYPDKTFVVSSGWDLNSADYDWAIASGIFTLDANIIYILWYIGFVMERLVKKGFAFNLLNNNAQEGLLGYDSGEVLTAIKERFPEYTVELIENYLPDDFTIYVKK